MNDPLAPDHGKVPRPGENPDFDEHYLLLFGDVDPTVADEDELRKAAWRTWRVSAPMESGSSSRHLAAASNEDDELARVLALSAKEHEENQGSTRASAIVIDDDDDDDEIARVIAESIEDSSRPPRPAREDTPEEERKAIAEALAASLAEAEEIKEPESDDLDEEINAANVAFQASRAAQREEQLREREAKRQKLGHSTAPTSASATPTISANPSPAPSNTATPEPTPAPASTDVPRLGLGGIDRAQMERERLARMAARIGKSGVTTSQVPMSSGVSDGNTTAPTKAPSSVATASAPAPTTSSPPKSERAAGKMRALPSDIRKPDHPLQSVGPFPRDAAGEYYLAGELRHVRLKIGQPTSEPTFSAQDVFASPSQMSLLVMSSFCWDGPWMDTFMPTADVVPTVRVCRPHGDNFIEQRSLQGKLRPMLDGEVHCYPDMGGKSGSEHMKFAWIFYKTGRLRVAIMTANMVDYDWDSIENTVFIQDFLPKGSRLGDTATDPTPLPDFPNQFRRLFAHLKVFKALRFLIANHPVGSSIPIKADENFADFAKWDWSRVTVQVVMSIAGTYRGFDKMTDYGVCRLGKIIEEKNWRPLKNEKVVAEYQGSSLGRYSLDWYNTFYQSCAGKSLRTISTMPKALTWPPLKVIFPSLATVDASVLGRNGGGTMFCGSSYTDKTASLFCDANSKRGGVLMHTKMLIAIFEPLSSMGTSTTSAGKRKADEMSDDGVGGWVYVGSHNFSPSAWGTVNFKNSPPTLNINNYELGIVFPLPRGNAQEVASKVAAHKRPARPYSKTDVPWSQKEHQ